MVIGSHRGTVAPASRDDVNVLNEQCRRRGKVGPGEKNLPARGSQTLRFLPHWLFMLFPRLYVVLHARVAFGGASSFGVLGAALQLSPLFYQRLDIASSVDNLIPCVNPVIFLAVNNTV